MELLIVINILLILFLVGTYLSLSGRVRKIEEAIRRKTGATGAAPAGREGERTTVESLESQEGIKAAQAGAALPDERTGAASPAGRRGEALPAERGVEETTEETEETTKETAKETIEETTEESPAAGGALAGGALAGGALASEPVPHRSPGRVAHMLRPRTREEWEILFGGKLLNRAGALALILAVGFFLKYAFDNDWLNETARVILGGAAGILLIAGGYRFHRRQLSVFSQGLTGAGVAILYLSIYAAFDFYHLVPQPVAFFLMTLVTAAALLISLYYDARAIALLGWAGGFLTPLLLVTAELNTLGLFVYLTLLDAGLIAILVRRRRWRLLELLAVAATYGIYLTWSFRADLPEGLGTALAFLTLWWMLFAGTNLLRSVTGDPGNRWWRRAAIAINALGFYVMLMRLTQHTEGLWEFFGVQFQYAQNASVYSTGVVTAVLSLMYFGLTAWIVRRTDDRPAAAEHATVAVLLAVLAPMSFFISYGVIIAWALEAFALFWFGVHYGTRPVRHAGTALAALSFVAIFLHGGTIVSSLVSAYVPILSLRTGAYWVVGGLLLVCAGMLQDRDETRSEETESEESRSDETRRDETRSDVTGSDVTGSDRVLFSIFHVAWSFLLLVWGTVEILSYFQYRIITLEDGSLNQLENLRQLAVSGVWLIGATLVMLLGRLLDIRALRAAAIVYFGCTVVKAFVFDLMMLDTLYRIAGFLALSAILTAVSYLYYRNRPAS